LTEPVVPSFTASTRPSVVIAERPPVRPVLARRRPIVVEGGGPLSWAPPGYFGAIHALGADLHVPAWHTWWSAADRAALDIEPHITEGDQVHFSARRGKASVVAKIARGRETFEGDASPVRTAYADMVALLALVERKMGLEPHPALPTLKNIESRAHEYARPPASMLGGPPDVNTLVGALARQVDAGLLDPSVPNVIGQWLSENGAI
jgi:hypothetical protein